MSPSSAWAPSTPKIAPTIVGSRRWPATTASSSAPRTHRKQAPLGAQNQGGQPLGLQQRPVLRAEARQRGALGDRTDGQEVDAVAVGVVDVEPERGLGHRGEHLQPDSALLEPGEIDVSDVAPDEQVATEHEGICVEIDDEALVVDAPGLVGDPEEHDGLDAVDEALQVGADPEEERHAHDRATSAALSTFPIFDLASPDGTRSGPGVRCAGRERRVRRARRGPCGTRESRRCASASPDRGPWNRSGTAT